MTVRWSRTFRSVLYIVNIVKEEFIIRTHIDLSPQAGVDSSYSIVYEVHYASQAERSAGSV